MKSTAVRLYIRARRSEGTRLFALPVFAANGRLRPQFALVDGQPQHCPGGVYHLRYAVAGKRVWENVGPDPQLALLARERKQRAMDAVAAGVAVADEDRKRKTRLADAIAAYLEDTRFTKSAKTAVAYGETMRGFAESVTKSYLEDLERKDVLCYMAYLRDRKNAPRTIFNRLIFLRTFFRAHGLTLPINKGDWPNYTEKVVSCYRSDELKSLLQVASQDERDMINVFLCTGGRKQEIQFAAWSDIDWTSKTLTIREKLDLGFRPKDREEGCIPLPDFLLVILRERRARYPQTRMIFELSDGKTEDHFLRVVKRLALKAGLNCGDCYSKGGKCCATHPVCKRIILHKLRKTFATMHHESGVSARTIQRWLRHSDLDTTLRYLAASDDQSVRTREQVNGTFAGLAGE